VVGAQATDLAPEKAANRLIGDCHRLSGPVLAATVVQTAGLWREEADGPTAEARRGLVERALARCLGRHSHARYLHEVGCLWQRRYNGQPRHWLAGRIDSD
jgi:hypothetical protein